MSIGKNGRMRRSLRRGVGVCGGCGEKGSVGVVRGVGGLYHLTIVFT